ncbi:MAG: hypothetical protein M3Q07_16645 [Pseudobdellovibrionaceae bacterium]|uniref:hypothetical protein n=1 Tax=Oligoflexus sp. TaxID=1971216 RepID=UPI0027BF05FE|nr:hypothetical protein [Oligoflexus sp.]MDQ3233449.1 hypothetical protein [Pseudobdellovibrionaceae bacterium]HYX35983.1 hypothetical protein [Oligoflexus sp.]
MKTVMMTLALVIATGCTTVGTTSTVAQDEANKPKKEEGLRDVRQQALLEALEGKKAQ